MKLLLDQNLSPRVLHHIIDEFPGSAHVQDVELSSALDSTVWSFALDNGFAIVSKDADFHQRSLIDGAPPKVVWIRKGNCSTQAIIRLLRSRARDIQVFGNDETTTFLTIE